MRTLVLCVGVTLLAGFAACTEKPQTKAAGRSDVPAYQGTGSAYAAQGWKAGDQAGWEVQTRTRTQSGQNEYSRASAQ